MAITTSVHTASVNDAAEALYKRHVPLAVLEMTGVIVRVVAMDLDAKFAIVESVNTQVQWRVAVRRISFI